VNGILLVDKPKGWTSHDVVAKVRSILRTAIRNQQLEISKNKVNSARGSKIRVGHTGTLDPMATGLLVVVIGSYTKRAGEFIKLDKVYEAELTLGAESSTGDAEGKIIQKSAKKPDLQQIEHVLNQLTGKIQQTPHRYSAVKVGGRRAYKAARAGEEVKLEPRQVTVNRLQVTEYKYPRLKIIAEVSSGTYIRSLAEDIGAKLGTGAYLSALRRTKIGQFDIRDAVTLDRLKPSNFDNHIQQWN